MDVTRGIASWMGAFEGPNITTSAISPLAYCAGDPISVPYAVGGGDNFSGGNIFTAQLSNSTGDFSSPINIGTLAGTVSGTINGTIPLTTGSASYTAQGSFIWTCPPGVTTVSVECWGGGGGGGGSKAVTNNSAGGGGAGGSYAKKTLTVIPGNNYTVNVGNGGPGGFAGFPGTLGSDSWFDNVGTVKAQGGQPGSQGSNGSGGMGSIVASVGDVLYAGGNGGMGTDNFFSGGGGGGAGSGGNGGNAAGMPAGSGTAIGGGNGESGGGPGNYSGIMGSIYGGGGSGGYRNNIDQSGGAGANGRVDIKYLVSGSGYRVRVVSSDPVVTGSDNGSNLNIQSAPPSAPTANAASASNCSGFTSNWTASPLAATYYLDVATDAGFTAFVTGYNNLDVGNVTSKVITELIAGTTYYYRVRASNGCGTSGNSGTQSATTTGAQRVLVVSSTANGTTTDGVSLRWAITEANNNCGHDSIHFGFGAGGPFTISLTAALPAITGSEGVTIDGFNNSWCALTGTVATNGTISVTGTGTSFLSEIAPGALININGEKRIVATVPTNLSLTVTTAFSLTAASQKAFKECAAPNNGTPNTVAVFDATATPANPMNPVYKVLLGNGGTVATGFVINSGSNYNVIKGLVLQDFGDGTPTTNDIAITLNGNNNKVLGCYFGMDAAGTTKGTKTNTGINISGANNMVGNGTAAGANLISGINGNGYGVYISGAGASGNSIRGNMIGLQKDGSTMVAGATGRFLVQVNSANNTVGGINAGDGNVISGANSSGGDTYGIIFTSTSTGDTVVGNIIGPRADGTNLVSSNTQKYGVLVDGGQNHVIGGNTPGARNIISGNEFFGVVLFSSLATGNKIKGNYIGTDKTGTSIIAGSEQDHGVIIWGDAVGNTVGGSAAGEGNVLSGNKDASGTGRGITLASAAVNGNTVTGNIIGPQADGVTFLASNPQGYGIYIDASPDNIIGGNSAGTRNIISGNQSAGVYITGAGSTGNTVKGNNIGIDATGTTFIAGSSQNYGIFFNSTSGGTNTIGGSGTDEGNVISGNNDGSNAGIGIYLSSTAAAGNTILGNTIGPQADGITNLASNAQGTGISIVNSMSNANQGLKKIENE